MTRHDYSIRKGSRAYLALKLLDIKPDGTFNYKISRELQCKPEDTSYTMYKLKIRGFVENICYGKFKITEAGKRALAHADDGSMYAA